MVANFWDEYSQTCASKAMTSFEPTKSKWEIKRQEFQMVILQIIYLILTETFLQLAVRAYQVRILGSFGSIGPKFHRSQNVEYPPASWAKWLGSNVS